MNRNPTTRQRPNEIIREARRMSQTMAESLGRAVRSGRLRLRLTQAELAARVGIHQTALSRIELGHGVHVPLGVWVALGLATGQPLAVSFSRPVGETREPSDAGHLAMQERLLELARATGRTATFELPTRSTSPRYSIDVCVRDPHHRVLIVQEAWNTFGDLGAAIRSTNRKTAEAADLAAIMDDGSRYRVATVWVVRATAANRSLVARYPHIFHSGFPGSSRSWTRALTDGEAPPDAAGLVWLDPETGRISEWRKPRPR